MATTLNAGTASSGAAISADTTGILQLQSGSTPTTAVTINTSQQVGIGTTSPSYRLHVSGNGTGTNSRIGVTNTGTSSTTEFGNDANGGFMATSGAFGNLFYTNDTERMRIDSSGRVLIGTTSTTPSPSNTYGVVIGDASNGSPYAGVIQASSNGNAALSLNRGSDSGTTAAFRQNGTVVGAINVTGSSTSYVTSSDYRLKEDIAPMTGALDTVSALKPVTYKWKSTGEESQGFIAHELQAVVPDCVTGEKDAVDSEGNPQYQGIDTSFLVATLTAAIQEQQALITQLQADVAALKGAK
jgi:hypothetical protein